MPRLLLLAALATLAASPALAQTCSTEWAAPVDGVWTVATNWTSGVPEAGDNACITASGTYTVSLGGASATVASLTLGGASGTQTLSSSGVISIATGGALDVAPSGTLHLIGSGGRLSGASALFRIRGLLDVTGCPAPNTGSCNVDVPLEVIGGTVRAGGGVLLVRGGALLRDATLEVAADAQMILTVFTGSEVYTIEGTVGGDVQGLLLVDNELRASAAGGTLNFGGNGLLASRGTFFSVRITTAGGVLLNTGLLRSSGLGMQFQGLTFENEGTLQCGSCFVNGGAVVRNRPGGTFEIPNTGSINGTTDPAEGRVENAGMIVHTGTGTGNVNAPLDGLPGSTIRATAGALGINTGGSLNGVAFDVAAGASVSIGSARFVVEGMLTGDIQGTLSVYDEWSAGPAGVTFAFTGTGLRTSRTTFYATPFTSSGGTFRNTGIFTAGGNGMALRQAVFDNEGTVRILSGIQLQNGAVLRNLLGGTVELHSSMSGDGRFENAGLVVTAGTGFAVSFGGRLRSVPGSEIRVLAGGPNLDLDAPGSRTLPAGASLTGNGVVTVPRSFEGEGIVSPGTDAQPLARLAHGQFYFPSQVAGSPRLVIDVDAGGRSDTLDVSAFGADGSTSIAILAGALVVRVRPGYMPAVGDAFTILTALRPVTGQFAQIAVIGAPDGIAFVTELSADQTTVLLRAVAVAPGGPITVSTTTPIAGGIRPLFLTGPGAPGVTAARLDCTECLDPSRQSRIDAVIVGEGTLREARFDLTSTRIVGAYNLVLQRPGQPDEVMPVTVRPFLSFVQAVPVIERGIGVRPAGLNYNWSGFDVRTATNAAEPTYALGSVGVEDAAVEYAVASGNPFGIGARVLYESQSGAPAPLVFGRIPVGGTVPLTFGQRIDPSDVRFPEQASTGPDDARIPFGADRLFATLMVQHASYERMRRLVVQSLRESGSAPLAAYLGQVDAADAGAVDEAVGQTLQARSSYVDVAQTLFDRVLTTLGETVAVPPSVRNEAGAFDAALDRGAEDFLADVTLAHLRALPEAPASVQALFDAEVDALAASSARLRGDDDPPLTLPPGFCDSVANLMAAGPTDSPLATLSARAFAGGSSPYTPAAPTLEPTATEATHTVQSLRNISQQLTGISSTLSQISSSIGGAGTPPRQRAGSASRGGFGGGTSCSPPAAPADPNDKSVDTALLCEFGTVTVDGEEVSRCVRHFVPLADAAEPIVYTIQFENLPQATANAEFVTITDELDANLNPATLRVLATSSDSTFSMSVSGRTATFRFTGIDLPPNVTAPEGQGFVTFSVAPVSGLAEGTVIENDADIVFDFNPAIATPVVTHEIRRASDLTALITEAPDFANVGGQVPVSAGVVNLRGDRVEDATLTISLPPGVTASSAVPTAGECSGSAPVVCAFGGLDAGEAARVDMVLDASGAGDGEIRAVATTTAFDGLTSNDTDVVSFEIRPVGTEGESAGLREPMLASPFPNPARGAVSLRWGLPTAGRADLRVFDLLGREVAVLAADAEADAGWHVTPWTGGVASGVYVVRFQTEVGGQTVTRTRRLVVIR